MQAAGLQPKQADQPANAKHCPDENPFDGNREYSSLTCEGQSLVVLAVEATQATACASVDRPLG